MLRSRPDCDERQADRRRCRRVGGALAALIAGATTSDVAPARRRSSPHRTPRRTAGRGARRRNRAAARSAASDDQPPSPARNLFQFGARASRAAAVGTGPCRARAALPVADAARAAAAHARRHRRGRGPTAPVRTAIISGFGDLFLVKEGDRDRRSATASQRVDGDGVELIDLTDGSHAAAVAQVATCPCRAFAHGVAVVMSVAIIINPISGGARPRRGARRAELAPAAARARAAKPARCSSPSAAVTRASWPRRRVARGARLVIAWGGDGTVNEVASALLSDRDAARHRPVGLGQRPGARARRATPARARAIAAALARGAARDRRRRAGRPAVLQRRRRRIRRPRRGVLRSRSRRAARPGRATSRITARELLTYRPATYRDRFGGGDSRDRRALLVTLANSSQFGNGARIAPRARLDDGRLDLVVFEESSRLRDAAARCRGSSRAASNGVRGMSIASDRARDASRATRR